MVITSLLTCICGLLLHWHHITNILPTRVRLRALSSDIQTSTVTVRLISRNVLTITANPNAAYIWMVLIRNILGLLCKNNRHADSLTCDMSAARVPSRVFRFVVFSSSFHGVISVVLVITSTGRRLFCPCDASSRYFRLHTLLCRSLRYGASSNPAIWESSVCSMPLTQYRSILRL